MNKTLNKVLNACVDKARKGEMNINVFDLMYETSLPYPELKTVLDKLIQEKELNQTDLKTYEFIGEVNRTVEEDEKKQPFTPVFENAENGHDAARLYGTAQERNAMKEEQLMREYAEADGEEEPITDLSDFVINVFSEKLNPDVFIEPPLHPSWSDKSEFMQYCADHLIILMNSDKQMGRLKAIKKARVLLGELQKARNKKTAEIYEYILYALAYMSNYYYNKIRENLS